MQLPYSCEKSVEFEINITKNMDAHAGFEVWQKLLDSVPQSPLDQAINGGLLPDENNLAWADLPGGLVMDSRSSLQHIFDGLRVFCR